MGWAFDPDVRIHDSFEEGSLDDTSVRAALTGLLDLAGYALDTGRPPTQPMRFLARP
jgi:hypothetical protein